MDTIFQLVKKAEKNLIHGKPIKIGKYATHDHVEKLATIDAYLNSQHISGKTDSLGREKPFNNISTMAAYTWYKTTDLDRKNISFSPSNVKQRLKSLIATIQLRRWMDKEKFGHFLNKWGYVLACYGSAVTKFVEKEGRLIPSVVAWDRLICDPVDFYAGLRVEKLYFTPDQLRKQNYDKEAIEEAIGKFREIRETLTNEDIDNTSDFIGVYEVHGELPLYHITKNENDMDVYRQQMHVLFISQNPKTKKNVEVTLYSGIEKKDPYFLSHLIEQDGRTLAVGAVESIFDNQWMVNHSSKQIKDQMDLASKLVSQTSDPDFLGRNILTEIESGSVLIHKENQPLTQVNLQSHDIPNLVNLMENWKQGARDISGMHESVTGEQPPSGTPFRLQAMLSQMAHGLFGLMRQNKGMYLEDMIREFVLPYFKKQLKNNDQVMAVLQGQELENFDKLSLPARLSEQLIASLDMIDQGMIPTGEDLITMIQSENAELGNVRPIVPSKNEDKTWAEYFDDLDLADSIEIEITGENKDKNAILSNLYAIFQILASNPQALQDPNVKKIFDRIIDEIGMGVITPMQFSASQVGTTGGETGVGMAGMPTPGAGQVGALSEQPMM